jgi:hypothetical protein
MAMQRHLLARQDFRLRHGNPRHGYSLDTALHSTLQLDIRGTSQLRSDLDGIWPGVETFSRAASRTPTRPS